MNDTEMEVEIILEDEIPERTFSTNPVEIILRSREFPTFLKSLSEEGTLGNLSREKKLNINYPATFQSTLTEFKYLSREWKRNCDEERLLGVSLTGIMDNPLTNGSKNKLKELLEELRDALRNE